MVQRLCGHWLVSGDPFFGELGWGEVAVRAVVPSVTAAMTS